MATRPPVDRNLLADLVERRLEALDVEYKNFMPLTDAVERAKIARHVCALANAGGGWLVFGFEDDGTPGEPHPGDLSAYNQDAINGISERYLEPQPHCEVHVVTASTGLDYPVVRVPSHGSSPICAKASGPQDERRRPQGIVKGTHYVRAPGPRSVPIDTPELWRDVLRRCVIADRTSLLSSIGQLFDKPQAGGAGPGPLPVLVDGALARWTAASEVGDWPVAIATNRVAFGFRLADVRGEAAPPLSLTELDRALRDASSASANLSRSGDGAFTRGHSGESRPGVIIVGDREAYTARQQAAGAEYLLPHEWFVRDDGAGVEVAGFAEDNPWVTETIAARRSRTWPAGERLAPTFQVDMMAERIAFVGTLAASYPAATRCELMVDYAGLSGRLLDETAVGAYFSIDRSSRENARRVSVEVGVAALTAELPEVVAALVAPIFRLFEWEVSADYVRHFLNGGRR